MTWIRNSGGHPVTSVGYPSWRAPAVVNEWLEISGTSGGGGARSNDYSGWAITPSGRIVIAASGGHGTGTADNRVVSLDLFNNSPSWTLRIAASTVTHDTDPLHGYETDGIRKASHTYHSTFYSAAISRVLVTGVRFDLEGATHDNVDGVDPTAVTWVWDAAGTYANLTPSAAYCSAQDGNGDLWWFSYADGHAYKYAPASNTWSTPTITGAVSPGVRYPWCWDSTRSQFFGLAWADGEGFGTGMSAVMQVGTTQSAIAFDAGSAATVAQFASDAPSYAGMCYDPINDRFLFFSNDHSSRIYVITPNGTTTWSMSLLTLGGGSAALPAGTFPVVSKFTYVPSLGGVVAMIDVASNLYFLRTS